MTLYKLGKMTWQSGIGKCKNFKSFISEFFPLSASFSTVFTFKGLLFLLLLIFFASLQRLFCRYFFLRAHQPIRLSLLLSFWSSLYDPLNWPSGAWYGQAVWLAVLTFMAISLIYPSGCIWGSGWWWTQFCSWPPHQEMNQQAFFVSHQVVCFTGQQSSLIGLVISIKGTLKMKGACLVTTKNLFHPEKWFLLQISRNSRYHKMRTHQQHFTNIKWLKFVRAECVRCTWLLA